MKSGSKWERAIVAFRPHGPSTPSPILPLILDAHTNPVLHDLRVPRGFEEAMSHSFCFAWPCRFLTYERSLSPRSRLSLCPAHAAMDPIGHLSMAPLQVCFWDLKSDERRVKQHRNLELIGGGGEHVCLVTGPNEGGRSVRVSTMKISGILYAIV